MLAYSTNPGDMKIEDSFLIPNYHISNNTFVIGKFSLFMSNSTDHLFNAVYNFLRTPKHC
jgi:hypothetical protein